MIKTISEEPMFYVAEDPAQPGAAFALRWQSLKQARGGYCDRQTSQAMQARRLSLRAGVLVLWEVRRRVSEGGLQKDDSGREGIQQLC
jgi:hypothetical protein